MNRAIAMVVYVCLIMVIFAWNLNGCVMIHNDATSPCHETATDAGEAGPVADAADSAASMSLDAESPDASASRGMDGSADGGVDPVPWLEAVTISPSLCSDRTTHLPAGLFRPGFSVWQLCYTTQGSHQADARETPGRPSSVLFTRFVADMGVTVELVRYSAPAYADPWTASVAISLPDPPTSYPLFNVRNDFPDGRIRWAVDRNADGSALETRGSLRLWRVYADGHKTRYVPRVVTNHCTDLIVPDPTLSGSFFPTGSLCPDTLLTCPAGPYSCFGVY